MKRLHVLFSIFNVPVTDEIMQGYLEALQGLTPEQVDRGCIESAKRSRFLPKAAEIRESATTDYTIREPEGEECPICKGTGYKLVDVKSGYKLAVVCDCRKARRSA